MGTIDDADKQTRQNETSRLDDAVLAELKKLRYKYYSPEADID